MAWRVPHETAPVPGLDLEECRRALALLTMQGAWVGLRALIPDARGCRGNHIGPTADVDGLLKLVEGWQRQGLNVYLNLNPVAPGTQRPAHLGPLVENISSRRWLFIDVDPVRVAGFEKASATEEEKARCLALTVRIRVHLCAHGWPLPVTVDSGNGFYLLYRIDLASTDESRELVKSVLGVLGKRFSGADGEVDTCTYDAPRIAKLPGTLARKGPHTAERPHRPCRLIDVPTTPGVVEEADLVEFAGVQAQEPKAEAGHQTNGTTGGGWRVPRGGADVEARAVAYMDSCPPAVGTGGQGGHPQTFKVARAVVYGFDLGQARGFDLLDAHYNPRCVPPWDEKDLRHKCKEADTKPFRKERGWLLKEDNPQWRAEDFNEQAGPAAEPSLHASAEPWPAPPAEEAYHGLAGEIVRRIDQHTEADPVAVLAQLLVFFGNAAGRNAYRTHERSRHHTNLFLCLVGKTAKGRKGTSLAWVEALFAAADPVWYENCLTTGLSSGEGLIHAVRDRQARRNKDGEEEVTDDGVADKRLLVVEEEFAQTLRLAARDGNILSPVLRQAWDGRRLRTLTKQSPLRATNTHVSNVAHVTRNELVRYLTTTDQSNGMANRYLWLAVRRSKLLPDGGGDVRLDDLADRLRDALQYAWHRSRMDRSLEARDLWWEEYPRLTAERSGVFGLCTNRAEPQVLRLAIVYALLDSSPEIRVEHLRAALALWDYCERSCRWIFGEGVGDPDADEILGALRVAGPLGMSGRDVHGLFSRNRTAGQLRKALTLLVEAGLAVMRKESQEGKPGRPAERWFYSGGYESNEQNEQPDTATT